MPHATTDVDATIAKARASMATIEAFGQPEADQLVRAVAWAIYRDDRALALAEASVEDTGLGNVADKVIKNQRKTLGTLRDLLEVRTVGVIEPDNGDGITTFAKPVGVVGALTPSTNPGATPANQAMMALKSKNAIVISPSPSGRRTARMLESYVHEELERIGAPVDLFQVLPDPISLDRAQYLAAVADLVLVTGDQENVRNGYRSGTPCIGVGKGNVPVFVDESADLADAAAKICASKCFDNATSCSSENSVIVHDSVYGQFLDELQAVGGFLCDQAQAAAVESALFVDGAVNREFVGQPAEHVFELAGIPFPSIGAKFLVVEQSDVGPDHLLSGEKLSLVLSVYKVSDFEEAIDVMNGILAYEGIGHSVGIHTSDPALPRRLAAAVPVGRVLVNQAHTFGNGGGFDNYLPFSLSMGCGTWAGNSISRNLSYRDFFNETRLVHTVERPLPEADQLFAGFG